MIRVAFWLFLALLFAVAPDGQAQTAPMRIAVSQDSYPYQYRNSQNEPAGYLVDFWRRWSEQNGQPVTFELMSWPDSIVALSEGRVDLHAGVARSAKREARFALSEPLLTVPLQIFIHRDLPRMTELANLAPYRIGVVAQSVHEELLTNRLPSAALVRFPSREALLTAALNGEVMAFANLDGYLQHSEQQHRISRQFPAHRRLPLATIEVSAATLPEQAERIEQINQDLNQIGAGVREVLARRWLGQTNPQAPLKVGVTADMPPLMYNGKGGRATGLLVDLWRAWSAQTGVPVQFVTAGLGPAGLSALRKGELDLFAGHVAAEVGKLGLEKAYELYQVPTVLIVRKGQNEELLARPELALGYYTNAGYETWLSNRPQQITRFSSDQPSDLLSMLADHKVDGVLLPEAVVPVLDDTLEALTLATPAIPLNVLVAIGDNALTERVKRGFAELPPKQVLALTQYWTLSSDTSLVGGVARPLISDPRPWLVERSTLPQWAWSSLDVERMLSQLGRVLGVTMLTEQPPESGDRPVPVSLAIEGESNPLSPWAHPILWLNYVLVSETPLPEGVSLAMQSLPLVVLDRSPESLWLKRHYPFNAFRTVRNRAAAVSALESGQVLLLPKAQWQHWGISHPSLFVSTLVDPPRLGIYLSLPEEEAAWQPYLNQAVHSVSRSGEPRSQGEPSMMRGMVGVLFWISVTVIPVLALGFILIYRRWRWEQIQRRELEQQHQRIDGIDPVTGLPGRSMLDDRLGQALLVHAREHRQMAVLLLDLDGFGALNRRLGWDKGDLLLNKVVQRWRTGLRRSDTLARLRGDQFVVILNQVKSVAAARHVAEVLMMELDQPIDLDGTEVSVSASIGVAVFPQHGADAVGLLQAADRQLRFVKGQGGGGYQVA
ncbi:diguanylate cyclase domain-containing protein [Ferrimonas balearica]|uniref:diguanylate cyclase domain-containing protein n=1 Tax=Ferrimonas balearica TaxID=44012 RepID=UPI001C996C98|nr:transporter substrate-binding domain-containing protein [Ferrimonas balearica]MBY5920302.1 transporter substrate-binding domain-containing protein [Ferrimonas balearica]MBY5997013.1 transporter substrate-binding domain-containing protein [Ferrimonas balearica]